MCLPNAEQKVSPACSGCLLVVNGPGSTLCEGQVEKKRLADQVPADPTTSMTLQAYRKARIQPCVL